MFWSSLIGSCQHQSLWLCYLKYSSQAFLALIALATIANAASKKAGSTVEVNNIYYYAPPIPISQLKLGLGQLKLAAA